MLQSGSLKMSFQKIPGKPAMVEQAQEKDVYQMLEEKNQKIRKLEFQVQKLEKEKQKFQQKSTDQAGKIKFFKERIAEQIETNEKVYEIMVKVFKRIVNLIQILQVKSDLSSDKTEIQSLLQNLCGLSFSQSFMMSDDSSTSEDCQDLENLHTKIEKKFDDLEVVADQFRKTLNILKKSEMNSQEKIKILNNQNKEMRNFYDKELKRERDEKQALKKVLQKAEVQKMEIVNSISGILSLQGQKELQKMSKIENTNFVKKLFSRIKDLESDKKKLMQIVSKNKNIALQKYKKMLTQVKQTKERSILSMSVI